jgi:putative oxidoreductase
MYLGELERKRMIATNTLPAASSKGRLITLWTLSGLVALMFVFVGGGKLAGTAAMIELFDKVGIGQWFRYLTGLLEVGCGIGLLIPRYAFYAAVLLDFVMIGAIITHVAVVGGSPAPAASLFVLSGIIAWLRKP